MEDWSGWAKEMLAENGFVEILRAVGILKLVALSQTLQISGNVECLRRLDPRHIALTLEERATLVALKKEMRRNANALLARGGESTTLIFRLRCGTFEWAKCIPLAIPLVEGVKLPLAPLMLGTLYHMLDLLRFDEILGANYYIIESRRTWSLECYYLEKVARQFGYDQDVPHVSSSDKTDWNKAMQPYIDEVTTTMWSEGAATLRFFSIAIMSTRLSPMLEYWGTLLKKFEAFIQSLSEVVEYDPTSLDWRIMDSGYPSILPFVAWQKRSITRLVPLVKNLERADEAAPPKRSILGKRKSVTHPPKSRACRTSTLPTSKQSKAKASTPFKAKTAKEKDTSHDSKSNESSWGDPNPVVIDQIKRLRLVHGGGCLGEKYYDSSASFQSPASSKGFGLIHIPSDDKVLSKSEEAKRVEALAMNMEEALANLEVRWKILASEIGEPPLPDNILNVVDFIINWSDPAAFTVESAKKAKASKVPPQKPTTTRGGVKVSYGTPSMTKKPETAKTQPESRPISELPLFKVGDFELVLGGFIPMRKTGAAINEKGVEKGEAKVAIGVSKEKGKKVTKHTNHELSKKVTDLGEAEHSSQSSTALAKLGRIDDSIMRLLKNLDEMNEYRDVSLAQFGLVPLGVKKVVVKDAFSILCATMRHIEVTPFVEMNEDFFYLCKDALEDAESINFEVNALRTHLSNLATAYLGMTKFGMAEGDMAKSLDERIKEQVKHIEKMEKSLVETKELVIKLEEGLVSAKAYLGSLN
ncbi:hypothetical protein SLEP1_g9415 [Rubroshorea leprosula]|uniref:Aminotransferase-like plant mobile domain-containing protein n=1 Tax=Rubroshorea leprosula TaxID=152421 RepID=A0AAV5IG23_9ROSI|nr:hypothetical protein SLEP1_g9415 [Rubroshorea leprosula]